MRYRLFFRKGNRIAVVRCSASERNKHKSWMIRRGYTFCGIKGGR